MTNRKILLILCILISIPLILYLCFFHNGFSRNSNDWGLFGSYVGGTFGTLSILVLAYSIYQSRVQFQSQSEDQLFFKLIDTQQQRIISSTINDNGLVINSYEVLAFLLRKIQTEIADQSIVLGRVLLRDIPSEISLLYYQKLFFDNTIMGYEEACSEAEELYNALLNVDRDDRWELLKTHIGNSGMEDTIVKNGLRSIGSVYFYRIKFDYRLQIYSEVYYNNSRKYGSFYDGYFKNLEFLSYFIQKSLNKISYLKFLNSQLTKFEKLFIIYYLASGSAKPEFCQFIKENHILNDLHVDNELFIDVPDKKDLDNELGFVFSIYDNIV